MGCGHLKSTSTRSYFLVLPIGLLSLAGESLAGEVSLVVLLEREDAAERE